MTERRGPPERSDNEIIRSWVGFQDLRPRPVEPEKAPTGTEQENPPASDGGSAPLSDVESDDTAGG